MNEENARVLPANELDFNLMTTDSVWGKSEVPPELKSRLNQLIKKKDESGTESYDIESLWGLLGFYTRDMRLANLNPLMGEVSYCQYFLDLANDLLQAGMTGPFLIALSRVATMLELSQSKGGFLRRKMNTFTQEKVNKDEPPKKHFFGGSKKGGDYY